MIRQQETPEPFWYKDAIIYELHVRSFFDSNGDGIGDFPGLTQKLDYLTDLGITALWLLPFYPSPLKDDGYDIADYYTINPIYGTLSDFKKFLREAHRRGLRVITELVLNHTSDQHAWFQRSRRAPPGSPWRDFYVWTQDPTRYRETRIIFKDFEPSNWSWDPVANAYYWHRFYAHQPDLNFDSPLVHEEIFRVLDFWCELGVDGFRLDAIPYLYEREGTSCESLPETHQFLKKLRAHVDARFGDRMLLAEANQWPEEAVTYFGSGAGDECHMAFHFPLMPRLFMALRMEDRMPIADIIQQTPRLPETSQWALFLRNHDELTLEMVTDEERDYMYRVYANDLKARINLGIRRRLAPLLGNSRSRIELLNLLLFSLPGTPIVYYGDEIGMGDNIYLGDRNGVRTPMHWSSDKNAGFSRASPQALPLPIIIDPECHYESSNVETQLRNPNSLLWWTKRLINVRKRYKAFGRGTLELLEPDNRKVFAFVRAHENETILVVANLSRYPQPVHLDLAEYKDHVPVEIFGRSPFPVITGRPYFLTLSPHAAYWLVLEPAPVTSQQGSLEAAPRDLPQLVSGDAWQDVLRRPSGETLKKILVDYVRAQPWFLGDPAQVSTVEIGDAVPFRADTQEILLVLLRVEYLHDEPEQYLLPLAFAPPGSATRLLRHARPSIIARVKGRSRASPGLLYDAVASESFARTLLQAMVRQRTLRDSAGEIAATSTPALRDILPDNGSVPRPVPSTGEQRNTGIFFENKLFLKLFRRIEPGTHPEIEAGLFLMRKEFPHVPRVAGVLQYRRDDGTTLGIGLLHEFVPNARSAWEFTLDALERYFERVRALPDETHGSLPSGQPLVAVALKEIPPGIPEIMGTYLESARLLGQRTAELHRALAAAAAGDDFAPEPFTPFFLRSAYQSMRNQVIDTLQLLQRTLPHQSRDERRSALRLLRAREPVLQRLRLVFESRPQGQRIRCHGNYHLGEVLHTGKDFVIIDLEGEPGRSIGERRIKRTPLHDVAKMLHSFEAAARAGLTRQRETTDNARLPRLERWASFWCDWVSAIFLKEYLLTMADANLLPRDRAALVVLVHANLLHIAFDELETQLRDPERRIVPALAAALRSIEMWRRDERLAHASQTRRRTRHPDVVR